MQVYFPASLRRVEFITSFWPSFLSSTFSSKTSGCPFLSQVMVTGLVPSLRTHSMVALEPSLLCICGMLFESSMTGSSARHRWFNDGKVCFAILALVTYDIDVDFHPIIALRIVCFAHENTAVLELRTVDLQRFAVVADLHTLTVNVERLVVLEPVDVGCGRAGRRAIQYQFFVASDDYVCFYLTAINGGKFWNRNDRSSALKAAPKRNGTHRTLSTSQ